MYNTCNQKDFNKHLQTKKHNNNTNFVPKNYLCPNCNKKFNDRTGLWRHKKICIHIIVNKDEKKEQTSDKEKSLDKDQLIMLLIKENTELKNIMMEQQNIMMKQQNTMMEQQNITMNLIEKCK